MLTSRTIVGAAGNIAGGGSDGHADARGEWLSLAESIVLPAAVRARVSVIPVAASTEQRRRAVSLSVGPRRVTDFDGRLIERAPIHVPSIFALGRFPTRCCAAILPPRCDQGASRALFCAIVAPRHARCDAFMHFHWRGLCLLNRVREAVCTRIIQSRGLYFQLQAEGVLFIGRLLKREIYPSKLFARGTV